MWYFADGAPTSTAGKSLNDGNIDLHDQQFPSEVRRQTHWLNVNTPDLPAIVSRATARTIGVGVTTQVESPHPKFNAAAEAFIEKFNQLGNGELTGRHHFNSAIRLVSDFEILDGGVVIRHHYNTEWAIPYKFELVGVDMIDNSKTSFTYDAEGYINVAGVRLNRWNQMVGLWMFTDPFKRRSELVPANEVTYYSETWISIAQQMAVSRLSSILPTIDFLTQYTKAELASAIEGAKGGAYLKSTAYNEIMEIAIEQIRNSTTPQSVQREEMYTILRALAQTGVKPNGLTPIPSGDDVLFPTSKREGVFDALNNSSESKIASSQGMSAISMYGKAEQANYSAIKYAAETDQLSMNIRFDNIANKVIRPIHIRVIQIGVQIGEIPNRVGYWADPSAYHRFTYLRNTHVDIEPNKTAAANEVNLALGIKTKKEMVEQRTGRKYEDFLREKIASEIFEAQLREEMFAAAGVKDPALVVQKEKPKTEEPIK